MAAELSGFVYQVCLFNPLNIFLTAGIDMERDWHQVRIVMAEMIHVIRQMQAYVQLEVIECSWKALIDFLNKKEGDLDALIEAHRSYLNRMVSKVLLVSSKAGREVWFVLRHRIASDDTLLLQENILNQVRELFHTILQFREAIVSFHSKNSSV